MTASSGAISKGSAKREPSKSSSTPPGAIRPAPTSPPTMACVVLMGKPMRVARKNGGCRGQRDRQQKLRSASTSAPTSPLPLNALIRAVPSNRAANRPRQCGDHRPIDGGLVTGGAAGKQRRNAFEIVVGAIGKGQPGHGKQHQGE